MTLRLRALTCGWLDGPRELFLEGETGRLRVPVPAFLIEHPEGNVLFDSGLHVDAQSDPAGRLGVAGALFQVEYEPGQEVTSGLARCGVDPADIHYLVNSHLHFDHAGGNAQIPNATLVVQKREWEAGCDPDLAAANFFDQRDYDLGHPVMTVAGEHDLFGDGRITTVPTYGHTPGHQSLRVRLDSGDVVLTADACYLRQTLEELHLPSVLADPETMLESLRRLRRMRDVGARLVFGHDAEQWAGTPQGPDSID
jgi:glyoxylase-like metal-dependent hydrolase (beta-lactamase superfamily II)